MIQIYEFLNVSYLLKICHNIAIFVSSVPTWVHVKDVSKQVSCCNSSINEMSEQRLSVPNTST